MRDDLSGLTALLCVADKRSFTAAAAELRVTPSALSQSIRALEERVGVRLLQRTTRSVGLTEAGARFLSRVKPAMEGVREAFASLSELRDRPAGLLRLTLPRLGYESVVGPRLPEFLARYPEIDVELSVDDAFVDVVKEGFDLGLRIGEMLEREMISVRVSGDMRVAVVATPSYFAERGRPKHPRDLQQHDCINYRRRALGVVSRWEFTENAKDFQVAVEGRILIDDGDLMVDAALRGLGIAYVMESTVREALAAKRLLRVLDAFCVPFPGLYLYYPSRAQIAPKVQAFVDFFKLSSRKRR